MGSPIDCCIRSKIASTIEYSAQYTGIRFALNETLSAPMAMKSAKSLLRSMWTKNLDSLLDSAAIVLLSRRGFSWARIRYAIFMECGARAECGSGENEPVRNVDRAELVPQK